MVFFFLAFDIDLSILFASDFTTLLFFCTFEIVFANISSHLLCFSDWFLLISGSLKGFSSDSVSLISGKLSISDKLDVFSFEFFSEEVFELYS